MIVVRVEKWKNLGVTCVLMWVGLEVGGDIEDEDKDGGKDGVQLMIRE